jgi:hypothetical protein
MNKPIVRIEDSQKNVNKDYKHQKKLDKNVNDPNRPSEIAPDMDLEPSLELGEVSNHIETNSNASFSSS